MRTTMVPDALQMASSLRGARIARLRCLSDAGSQFTSVRCGEVLAELGAQPSIDTVCDSSTRWPRRSTGSTDRADLRMTVERAE